jgi:hypothetical protein
MTHAQRLYGATLSLETHIPASRHTLTTCVPECTQFWFRAPWRRDGSSQGGSPQDNGWPPSPGWPSHLRAPHGLNRCTVATSPSDSGPKSLGSFKSVPVVLALGPLDDTTTSSQGGSLSRPWVAALSRVAHSAFGRSRLCRPIGLAHHLDRVQLRRPSHLTLGPGIVKTTGHGKVPGPGLALASAGRLPSETHRRSPRIPTTSATHPMSMPHTTSSYPMPLLPEGSLSTSPSSSDTTRYVVCNGGPSLCQPSLTTRQCTPDNLVSSEHVLNPPMLELG